MFKSLSLVLVGALGASAAFSSLRAEFEQTFGQKPPRRRSERTPELQRTINYKLAELARKLKQAFAEENAASAALRAYELTMASLEAEDPEGAEIRTLLEARRFAAKACKKEFWTAHGLAFWFSLTTFPSWQLYASYR